MTLTGASQNEQQASIEDGEVIRDLGNGASEKAEEDAIKKQKIHCKPLLSLAFPSFKNFLDSELVAAQVADTSCSSCRTMAEADGARFRIPSRLTVTMTDLRFEAFYYSDT